MLESLKALTREEAQRKWENGLLKSRDAAKNLKEKNGYAAVIYGLDNDYWQASKDFIVCNSEIDWEQKKFELRCFRIRAV